MSNLETISTMLQDISDKQLPEVMDFIQYLREKNSGVSSRDVAKRLKEWDMFVETIHAAGEEEVGDFERIRFDREITV